MRCLHCGRHDNEQNLVTSTEALKSFKLTEHSIQRTDVSIIKRRLSSATKCRHDLKSCHIDLVEMS